LSVLNGHGSLVASTSAPHVVEGKSGL
jgi:hypothetical protein